MYVDYSIRPAKHVLRKLMSEVFRRLVHFASLDEYEYVGFGARELIDFAVFHKALGIREMTSIEIDRETYERAKTYNMPYGCITMLQGQSTEQLPNVGNRNRTIFWLDYTSVLNETALADVAIVCEKVRSGSVLVVTVNSEFRGQAKLASITSAVGDENVPLGTTEDSLSDWGAARVQKRILRNRVEEALRLRNLSGRERMIATDLIHIHYKDGAKMLTYGVVFYDEEDKVRFRRCKFRQLAFARGVEFSLKVPSLTRRERHVLDQLLPIPGAVNEDHPWLREDFQE